MVRYSFDPANPPPLQPEQIVRLEAMAALPDEQIDFSDIPAGTEETWRNAVRGKFFRPVKKQTTLRLDADLIDWFKRHAGQGGSARGYQTRINQALREYVAEQQAKAKKAG